MSQADGGSKIADVLEQQGVRFVFTLIGGHISPIIVGAKNRGIRIIDVRHEATAVFAADAVARLTGVPGVAAVTAGPGLTNTITAVKNAQLAQSPLVLLGGATATVLKGRGALQDIDQLALMRPHVKRAFSVRRVRDLAPALEEAFDVARSGVPGPTFVECPVDLLYPEETVRRWYAKETSPSAGGASLSSRALSWYINRHLDRVFGVTGTVFGDLPNLRFGGLSRHPSKRSLDRAAAFLRRAERPVVLVGSQALSKPRRAAELAAACGDLGAPIFLAGMARGLLGRDHPLQIRRGRKEALRRADVVLLAGVPCDFRLNYGRHIGRNATVITVNVSLRELFKNRWPSLPILADPGDFLTSLSGRVVCDGDRVDRWLTELRDRDRRRVPSCLESCDLVDATGLCEAVDRTLNPRGSVIVVDGGDFVATASYIVRPPTPLSWLDPGVFGTLGVGAGFALGARLCRPDAEVWLLYGDGSLGYSLAEFDTFARHGLSLIAVVGNDGSWAQIARDQVSFLGDDVATVLSRAAYHDAARGLGAEGLLIENDSQVDPVLERAKELAKQGRPVLVNAMISTTDARAGSISI